MQKEELLKYLTQGLDNHLKRGAFENGFAFRESQEEAFNALHARLHAEHLSVDEKIKGFFNIATGLGKSAILAALLAETLKAAEKDGKGFKQGLVVPDNQLLEQMPEEILEIAPSLKGKIGICGDGQEDLDKPVVIMNINYWDDAADKGLIGGHNFDALYTDEGHRGTSFRRVDRLKDAFNNENHATIQIAVTATAHFDQDKSVENTHNNLIYEKRLSTAVKHGEGAKYIQAHEAIIRIEPDEFMRSKEYAELSAQRQWMYTRGLREAAFNETAFLAYRDAHDEYTGDPLSDNQAAFFCRRTKQADNLAEMLNNDPELQDKAKRLGYKGVAVAIHSNGLTKKQQKEYFEAVQKRNEYMCIVGDSKFKEGFNHKPIKNIFSMPRKSRVDVEQIIGRGGREWYNEAKGRYEGLTVMDPIMYFGADDDEEEQRAYNKALRQTTRVKDIIGDTCVLGPGVDIGHDLVIIPSDQGFPKKLEKTVAVKKVGENEYQIRTFDKDGFIVDYDSFGEEVIDGLNMLFEKTELLEKQSVKIQLVEQIRVDIGEIWPRERNRGKDPFGDNKNVRYLTDFRDIYTLEQEVSEAKKEDWIEITDEMRQQFKECVEQTGLGAISLLNYTRETPGDLSSSEVDHIISGRAKTANRLHLDFIIKAYEDVLLQIKEGNFEPSRPISEEDAQKLKAYAEETGLGGIAIYARIKGEASTDLKGTASHIVSGRHKSARPSDIKALLQTYEAVIDEMKLGDFEPSRPISEQDAQKFGRYSKATQLGGSGIYKYAEKNMPDSLTAPMSVHIVSGQVKSARPSHVKALVSAYQRLEDEIEAETYQVPMPISEEDAQKLKAYAEETGLGGRAIYTRIKERAPNGLTPARAKAIISGTAKSAPTSHVTALLQELETLLKQNNCIHKEALTLISEEHKKKFKELSEATSLGGAAIYARIKDTAPEGLNAGKAKNLASGKAKSAPPSHVKALLQEYQAVLDEIKTGKFEPVKTVNVEDLKKLQELSVETKMTGTTVYRRIENTAPEGLNAEKAKKLVSGKMKSAPPSHVKALLKEFEQAKKEMGTVGLDVAVPISPKNSKKLEEYFGKTKLGGIGLFKYIKDNAPEALTAPISASIVSGKTKKARPSHLNAIFSAYAKVAQEMGLNIAPVVIETDLPTAQPKEI